MLGPVEAMPKPQLGTNLALTADHPAHHYKRSQRQRFMFSAQRFLFPSHSRSLKQILETDAMHKLTIYLVQNKALQDSGLAATNHNGIGHYYAQSIAGRPWPQRLTYHCMLT